MYLLHALPAHIHAITGVGAIRVGKRKVWILDWNRKQLGSMTMGEYAALGESQNDRAIEAAFKWAQDKAAARTEGTRSDESYSRV